jgi:hypothetical protein
MMRDDQANTSLMLELTELRLHHQKHERRPASQFAWPFQIALTNHEKGSASDFSVNP